MGRKVLVLEDDESVSLSISMSFEDCGYEVQTVKTAEEAQKALKSKQFDAVIVDIRLPGMNGFDFIRSVYDNYPKTSFVIITGSNDIIMWDDIKNKKRVCPEIFYKPIHDMDSLTDKVTHIHEKEQDS